MSVSFIAELSPVYCCLVYLSDPVFGFYESFGILYLRYPGFFVYDSFGILFLRYPGFGLYERFGILHLRDTDEMLTTQVGNWKLFTCQTLMFMCVWQK